MVDILFVPTALLYLMVTGALFIVGANFFYLTYLSWRGERGNVETPSMPENWPRVTVQLPIYNELYVAGRLIEAVARLDYPTELLEIQVLDDSTDETVQLISSVVEKLSKSGLDIHHIHRTNRIGYKAGALAEGLLISNGELIAIFDADFIPPSDFLMKTVPHFYQNPRLAFVQTRWGHLNRSNSILTMLQAIAIDAHFMVEQFARYIGGFWFNFNGSGGVWRREAILDSGGWTADTLTEDLDLSYRAFLRGWEALFLRDVVSPAEIPISFSAYRRQQHRWARGSLECAIKLLPRIWQADLPKPLKIEATFHLAGYGVHLLMLLQSLLFPLVLAFSIQYPNLITLFGIAMVFNVMMFAPMGFFITAQRKLHRRTLTTLPFILALTALGTGMMLNTLRAAFQILMRREGTFERTPKFGLSENRENWLRKKYRLELDKIVVPEFAFAMFNLLTVFLASGTKNWIIGAYASMFSIGLLFTSGLTITHSLQSFFSSRRTGAGTGHAKNLDRGYEMVSLASSSAAKKNLIRSLPEYEIRQPGKPADLESAILQTVTYADIFDYPLTSEEIHRYLIGLRASSETVQTVLNNGKLVPHWLSYRKDYFTLPGRETIVEIRHRRYEASVRLWPKAMLYGQMIAGLPYVRMVAISGALAMNNVEPNDDIDFLIVTELDRLWICRAMVIILVRWAAMRGDILCPNYFLSRRALVFHDHSLYTAHEVVQMVPISGLAIYKRMRQLNTWVVDFLPNAEGFRRGNNPSGKPRHDRRLRAVVEAALQTPIGIRLERWEMERKTIKFNAKSTDSAEVAFCADWCKGHFDSHGRRTLEAFAERIQNLNHDI